MKTIISIITLALTLTVASCQKCQRCTPYNPDGTKNINLHYIELCNKTDIESYKTGTHFTDPTGKPVNFSCLPHDL